MNTLPLISFTSLITGQVSTIQGLPSTEAEPRLLPLSEIPERLLGASLVTEGATASRYLEALRAGDLARLERMLDTAIMIGKAWEERLGVKCNMK